MAKKLAEKEVDINTKLVKELLSKADPSELFGRGGLFNKLKKQLAHDLGYSKHSKIIKSDNNRRIRTPSFATALFP